MQHISQRKMSVVGVTSRIKFSSMVFIWGLSGVNKIFTMVPEDGIMFL